MINNLNTFAEENNLKFKNPDLLKQAFIHRSYLNEHRNLTLGHNERLEFLGDAVLELVVTDDLYCRYPDKPEGELTAYRAALVNANTLSELAQDIGMNDFLLLSRGEAKDKGRARQYILANTFEALIGAIYLDQGYEAAKKFIDQTVMQGPEKTIKKSLAEDYKSIFQKKAQEILGVTPSYQTLEEAGPDHNKRFTIGLFLASEKIAEGFGHSKQEAEQEAARKGLGEKGWG